MLDGGDGGDGDDGGAGGEGGDGGDGGDNRDGGSLMVSGAVPIPILYCLHTYVFVFLWKLMNAHTDLLLLCKASTQAAFGHVDYFETLASRLLRKKQVCPSVKCWHLNECTTNVRVFRYGMVVIDCGFSYSTTTRTRTSISTNTIIGTSTSTSTRTSTSTTGTSPSASTRTSTIVLVLVLVLQY